MMIYKILEERVFTNDGKVIPKEVEKIKIALKMDLLGRQFVFMQEGNGEDLIIYGEDSEKKKAAQAYSEVLERLSEWKFKEEKTE
jgi:hypothetical protein